MNDAYTSLSDARREANTLRKDWNANARIIPRKNAYIVYYDQVHMGMTSGMDTIVADQLLRKAKIKNYKRHDRTTKKLSERDHYNNMIKKYVKNKWSYDKIVDEIDKHNDTYNGFRHPADVANRRYAT